MKAFSARLLFAVGVVAGIGSAALIGACCPQAKEIVWEVKPGTYVIDPRIEYPPGTPYPALRSDTAYQLVISADGGDAVETYQRDGKSYEARYTLGPGSPNMMRLDTNLGND